MSNTQSLKNHKDNHKKVRKFITNKNFNKLTLYTNFDFDLLVGSNFIMLLSSCPKDILKHVFSNMININAVIIGNGWSLCHYLTKYNINTDLIKYLISEKGLNINLATLEKWQPIHFACTNSYDMVKLLIDNGVNIESKTTTNCKPIHIACHHGFANIVEMLINHGAKLESKTFPVAPIKEKWIHNSTDCDNNAWLGIKIPRDRPIHIACRRGFINIVQILIAKGVDLNIPTYYKESPIHIACQKNYVEIVKILINNNVNLEVKKNGDERPIHIACYYGFVSIVEMLIAKKVNLDCRTHETETPLSYVVMKRSMALIKMLIDAGANLEKKYWNGETILHRVCTNEYYVSDTITKCEIHVLAKMLIDAGANVKCLTEYKESPLHTAYMDETDKLFRLLVENGADLEQKATDGWKPIHMVCCYGSYEAIKYVLSTNVNVTSPIKTITNAIYDFCIREEILWGIIKMRQEDIKVYNPSRIITGNHNLTSDQKTELLKILNSKAKQQVSHEIINDLSYS